jgi:hypothetical protein
MKLAGQLIFLTALAILISCTSKTFESRLNVESYFNPDGNYGTYKTYGWVDYGTDVVLIEVKATRDRVVKAVEEAMESRGLKKDLVAPDLLIGYHGAVEQKLDQVALQSQYGEAGYQMESGPNDNVDSWQVGTLMLMVFDAKDGMMLWKATAQAELDERRVSQSEKSDRIGRAVQKMIETLPTSEDVDRAR